MVYRVHSVSHRVRTNNPVERTNRMFRLLKKVPDKWRCCQSMVRFVVLALDGVWTEPTAAWSNDTAGSRVIRSSQTESETRK